MKSKFAYDDPLTAIEAVAAELRRVSESESIPLEQSLGRITAVDIQADRDSPAADVSAMDGYAFRRSEIENGKSIDVAKTIAAGQALPDWPGETVLRIFTGAVVPGEADFVVRREDVDENDPARVSLRIDVDSIPDGANIRRRGENVTQNATVITAGREISPAVLATLANFGQSTVEVRQSLRVAILTTGNEVIDVNATPEVHQLRNSNRYSVAGVIRGCGEVGLIECQHLTDDPETLVEQLDRHLGKQDVVLLTGGVSMGDHDYVPEAIARAGGMIVFHRLAIRPGKPLLAAVGPAGQLIVGLPGNPVSATINARFFVTAWLRAMAGSPWFDDCVGQIDLVDGPERVIPLHSFPLVARNARGQWECVASKGSGDLVSLGRSEGFVHVPPNEPTAGRRNFYRW